MKNSPLDSKALLRCTGLLQIALTLSVAPAVSAFCQELLDSARVESVVAELKLSATPIRTADPADVDFKDLAPLKKTLQGVDLVLLGEQSHGEGSVFSTKIRLIKFLHEEMGFDVLAFESSFFGCAKNQDEMSAAETTAVIIPKAIYALWSGTAELRPLFEYLADTRKTNRPLLLAGFDSRMVTSVDCRSLTRGLETYLQNIDSSVVRNPMWAFTRATVDSLVCRERQYQMSPERWDSLALGIQRIQLELRTTSSSDHESRFWQKVLDNISAMSSFLQVPLADWKKSNSLRDQQMADNLLWLMKERYPGKRIVAWTASLHAARRLHEIEMSQMKPYDSLLTMGEVLYSVVGRRMYSVAFTGYHGSYSDWAGQIKSLDAAPTGTLEWMMNRVGVEREFFDLRTIPENSELSTRQVFARPTGYVWRPAIWQHHFDGFVFEKEVLPSTKLVKQAEKPIR